MIAFQTRIILVLLFGLIGTGTALAYDASWNRTDFWAGEYPNGFTLTQDAAVKIRERPHPDAKRDITCTLKKGETYHPWNRARVKSSGLEFVSFVRIVTYRIKTAGEVTLYDAKTDKDKKVAFKPGDQWTYLTYYGEGAFRMAYQGRQYDADQELFELSEDKGSTEEALHEWLKLTCANGKTGWLLLEDIAKLAGFERPNFEEYGKAEDVKTP